MVFSTLLEPFVTILNRLLAVLQPYFDLQRGNRPAKTTIEVNYDSLPPQLNIWRAARAGHYFLAIMSVVVLLINVLSIALGAIFNESTVPITTLVNVTISKTPLLTRDEIRYAYTVNSYTGTWQYYDHFYMVQSNMSNEVQLPAWIDEEFAYFPFSDATTKDNSSAEYSGITRGFGVAATCSQLSTSNTSTNYVSYNFNGTYHPFDSEDITQYKQTLSVIYKDANHTCNIEEFVTSGDFPTEGTSTSAQEVYTFLSPENGDNTDFCGTRVLLGWMRYEQGQPADHQPSTAWMSCESEFLTAQFNITIDASGHILRSERVGSYDDTANVLGANTTLMTSIRKSLNQYIGAYGQGGASSIGELGWHNDTLTRDWMNYFLKLAMNGTDLVDPSKPLPNVTNLIPTVERIYQRIGAALLGAATDLFADAQQPAPMIQAVMLTSDTRIFMDNTAYTISLVILGIYLVAGAMFYGRQRETLLPRLPTTIGSTIAFVAASRAVKVYHGDDKTRKSGSTERYGFGRYTGLDGKVHVGIELEPYMVPLRARSSWAGFKTWRRWHPKKGQAAKSLLSK